MKITFLDSKTVGQLPELEALKEFGEVEVFQTTKPTETAKRIKNSDIVITNKVVIDRKLMSKSSRLKLICVAATGTNNVDLEAAKEKNIDVKNVKGYSTDSVAQHTFAMLFALLNHISFYDKYVKGKKYSSQLLFTSLDREICELKGKRFGIIGLGAIGKRVAGLAQAFGAEVVFYSTTGLNKDGSFERLSLEELLKTSDVVSIHAPLTAATKNLIAYPQLQLMKRNAILLNTGRGGIIQEKDLAKALNHNLLMAAAIDVYEKEPMSRTHPFLGIKNKEKLLLTPHIAWSSVEARKELMRGVISNIREFINHKKFIE